MTGDSDCIAGHREFVRFESPAPGRRGLGVGVFGLANGLAAAGTLSEQDWRWWRANNDWCNGAYPDPESRTPGIYDEARHPGAHAWFRDSASELIAKAREYVALLTRYDVACIERRTASPGRVIYADHVQVVVVPRDAAAVIRPTRQT